MNNTEKRAYSRGFNAGRKGAWPLHRPPVPLNEDVKELMEALRALRDGVDSELATLCPDDEWVERLGPLVDQADHAFERIGEWLSAKV